MLTFLFVALLLVLITVAVIVLPLLRNTSLSGAQRRAQNIEYAREQLAEIDQQLADGAITTEDYAELKLEIEATLARDLDSSEAGESESAEPARSSSSNAVLITLLCCLLPISAVITYLLTGEPAAITRTAVAEVNESPSQGGLGTDINKLVQSLEQRLETNGDDIQGWTILARTYRQLGRLSDAVSAYRKLTELQPANPDVFAGLAEAISASRNGVLDQEARDAVNKVLSLNESHAQGLWLAGMAELQAGQNQAAIDYWQRLRIEMEGYPEQQAELDRVIQETAQAGGIEVANENAAVSEPVDLNAAATSENADSTASNGSIAVRVRAVLAEQVAEAVQPQDTVFIFARAKSGPPAPLAVKRISVRDLPISVTLTPEDAMLPQLSIANFPELELVARVSKSGQPIAQSGDIQSTPVTTTNTTSDEITLVIENLVD